MDNVSRGLFLWELIKSFRIFVTTLMVVVTNYREFFGRAFNVLGVSSTGGQSARNASASEFEYLKPLSFLGIAIGIAALFHPLEQAMLLDVARHHPGFSSEFVELLQHLSSTTMAERAESFGTVVIDCASLFGVPVLDDAVGNLVKYLAYLLFGLLVSLFSRNQADAKAMAYTFTYLVGIVLTVQTAVRILFTLLYWIVLSNDAVFNMQAMMAVDFLGSTGLGLYILFMPALILSATLGADSKAVLRGVIVAFVVWFITTFCLELILELNGIYLLNYGLSLSSL
jgi:hypothetical protein